MVETPYLNSALERLRSVFCQMEGAPLTAAELAASTQLDHDECLILLAVLHEVGAIDCLRSHVFICQPSSWWRSATVRPHSASRSSEGRRDRADHQAARCQIAREERSIPAPRFVSTPADGALESRGSRS